MLSVSAPSAMASHAREARRAGRHVGLVPTMGALHAGHVSLVEEARRRADLVVMSVFVNPLQFGPGEDFARYPRDLARDTALAREAGVDILWAPSTEAMYPEPPQVTVAPGPAGDRFEGAVRPGHFAGVLTVVLKLFGVVQPDVAVFGRKDFQQAVLIRRMARDLDLPVEVVVAPTVRERDGRQAWCTNSESMEPPRICASRSANSLFSLPKAAISVGQTKVKSLGQKK